MKMKNKISVRHWLTFIIAGLVGQLAWAIENNYLNTYVYDVTHAYSFIPIMTAASAAAATITTLFMGALSDRLGKRKAFISFGYILWGISIILFAFLDPSSTVSFVNGNVMLAGSMIVVMDCVMTFFGSTANDASFNAYVTDNTDTSNRGKVESFLSVLPLVSLIAIVVIGGMLVDDKTNTHWDIFFYLFGGITLVAGVVLLFIIPKENLEARKDTNYFKELIYGFRPSVIKKNKLLYITLLAFMAFNIAIQVYMPYFMVYIQRVLLIQGGEFTVTLGLVLVIACILTVVIGLFMDKIGKNKIIIPALITCILGGVLMTFAKSVPAVIPSGIILISGYLVGTAVLGAKIRDYTPKEETGLFQGVRMIFAVLIPMVTGPYIGQAVSSISGLTYVNDFGQTDIQPSGFVFFGAAVVFLIAIIPVLILLKKEKENDKK